MDTPYDFDDLPAIDEDGEGNGIENGGQKREKTLTEKGLQWQLDVKEQKLRKIITSWRRQASKIECLLAARGCVPDIMTERDLAMKIMTQLSDTYYDLDQLVSKAGMIGSKNVAPENLTTQEDNFAKLLAKQVSLSRPIPEPGVFQGDPLKYPAWKSAIDLLLENKGVPSNERFHFLRKYQSGPPREAIEGYFLIPTSDTYVKARRLLDERYVNPLIIADAFRKKLDSWPKIQNGDPFALRKFADSLGQCESAMHVAPAGLSFLDDSWLPSWLVVPWGRVLADWQEQKKGTPKLKIFADL
ncbi:hypothetical protein HOLleu_23898 [Holothuria leucospilota]|uniref:Uncharacterized protein n=1 Tax=Holothuria leucospilota TaxID=206669 RepID=A0A9Q1H5Z0_HOLLE|nr:hypothetical protein HOLleu_23898 [Holothuria leucospilota]